MLRKVIYPHLFILNNGLQLPILLSVAGGKLIVYFVNIVFVKKILYLCCDLGSMTLGYIFSFGYFLTFLLHQNLAVLNSLEERQQDVHARCIYPPLTMARCVRYISCVGVCVAYSNEWAAKALMWDK